MKKALLKRLFVIFHLSMLLVALVPFHIVSAYMSLSSDNIIGTTFKMINYTDMGSNVTPRSQYLYEVTVYLDNYYKGNVSYSSKITFPYTGNSNSTKTLSYNGIICDNKIVFNVLLLTTLIYDNQGLSITLSNVSLSSSDAVIYNPNDWTFPMESLNVIAEFANRNFNQIDLMNVGRWQYPVYKVPSGSTIISRQLNGLGNSNSKFVLILWVNKNIVNNNGFLTYFGKSAGAILSTETVMSFRYGASNSNTRIIKVWFGNDTSSTITMTLTALDDLYIMPIFNRRDAEMGFETQDFCDLFGLPYGANTQQTIDNIEDATSDFTDSSNDLFDYEDTFNESMSDNLDNIDVSFNVGNQLGSKFLASADWVRTQFNSLTNNTPFGTVLSFSLLLGIALLLIGRVFK